MRVALTTICVLCFPFGSLVTEAALAGEARPFRRIVFNHEVPLGGDAPAVAAEGNRAAFASGPVAEVPNTAHIGDFLAGNAQSPVEKKAEPDIDSGAVIYVLNAWTGETLLTREFARPGEDAQGIDIRVLGMVGGKVYAYVWRPSEPRPTPDGRVMVLRQGPEPGRGEVVAVDPDADGFTSLFELPEGVAPAEGLVGSRLAVMQGESMILVPLEDVENDFEVELGDEPVFQRLPAARGEEILRICRESLVLYRAGDVKARRIPFVGTDLGGAVPQALDECVHKVGDRIIVSDYRGGRLAAFDLGGRLVWQSPACGVLASSADGFVCVLAENSVLLGISPEDGRVLWRRYFAKAGSACQLVVKGGRLLIVGEKLLAVYDARTGKLLIELPNERRMSRRWFGSDQVLLRAEVAGNVLVIGFEKWVFGLDLTPTADVPAESQAGDPANCLSKLAALDAFAGDRKEKIKLLAEIGRNMGDTPQAAARVLPVLKDLLATAEGRPSLELLEAFHWLNDPIIAESMMRFLVTEAPGDNELHSHWDVERAASSVVNMLACHPAEARVRGMLWEIVRDTETHSVGVRETAARHLRLLGERPSVSQADLGLLYSGNQGASITGFRSRVRGGDVADSAALVELLGMAPDEVLVGLESDFGRLPEGELRRAALGLAREARVRLEAIERYRTEK